MGFFSALGTVINDQFGVGENTTTSLDQDGKKFGLLGDYADQIDHTAERSYLEDGIIGNIRPRNAEVIWQKPELTILVKKRMFSSLVENYDLKLLEEKEKLFFKASKKLFQNKTRAIAAYERLTKIERFAEATGTLNPHMVPSIIEGFGELEDAGFIKADHPDQSAFKSNVQKLRLMQAFDNPETISNWAIGGTRPYAGELGEGTGVIELTMVASVSTTVSTNFGSGNAKLDIEDPYKIMIITNGDIDKAIADSRANFKNNGFGKFAEEQTRAMIEDRKNSLNAARRTRGLSVINFKVNSDTIISKKVFAIMEGEGKEILFEYSSGLLNLKPEVSFVDNTGPNRLSGIDKSEFAEIVKSIYLLITYENATKTNVIEFNKETNYVRRKMRLHYANKPIIQPMDIVNVYLASHTEVDEKISQGLLRPNAQPGGGLLNSGITSTINNLVRNINNFGNKKQQLAGTQFSLDDVERNAIVGPEFPSWLWKMFKSDFTKQSAGLTSFVGLVEVATHNYSGGKYTLNVQCKDNASYFDKGQINIKPATDVFNGNLYDPLTPFDVSFDAATGAVIGDDSNESLPFLNENIILSNSKNIKVKTGRNRGKAINNLLDYSGDKEPAFGGARHILNPPDGFVYRWKEGIQSVVHNRRSNPNSSLESKDRAVALTKDPFAGQDVMNVLSLLITGQPYNFNTFLRSAIKNVNNVIIKNEIDNDEISASYIDGLVTDLSKRNAVWGNFIPFKKLLINDAASAFIQSGQSDFTTRNNKLSGLRKKRAKLMDDLFYSETGGYFRDTSIFPVDSDDGSLFLEAKEGFNPDQINISASINKLDNEITNQEEEFQKSVDDVISSNTNIKIIGDEITLDNSNSQNEGQETLERMELRRKLDSLTLRRYWKVKANIDTNMFIVDDQYDRNFDIQSFERAVQSGMKLLDSEYITVDGKISSTAKLLGLEVFADSQGHIQARPPQYNRVPSSVFYKMFQDKAETGIQVFPAFLESLFVNQAQGMMIRIEIVEDKIRLYGAALGYTSDQQVKAFISKGSYRKDITTGGFSFAFASDDKGKIGGKDIRNLMEQTTPDDSGVLDLSALTDRAEKLLEKRGNIAVFDVTNRGNAINDIKFNNIFSNTITDRVEKIRTRLQNKKGVRTPTLSEIYSDNRFKQGAKKRGTGNLDTLKVIDELSSLISERQRLLLQAANAIKSLASGVSLNNESQGPSTALFPHLNRKRIKDMPEILEHMIEDETFDSLGPGSGGRFVIRDSQIISLTITETPPDYTMVQVNGLFGEGFTEPPANLGIGSGGNAVSSAIAVDYDLWRMYGFRKPNAVQAPFFSDPESQCAPYAVYLLNLARKNILQGSVTVIGNEYYQAGDVVYIEDRDLLFYVEVVSSTFNYESKEYTTTLTLKYGRNPGEYIPTILDIVGKALYNTKNSLSKHRNARFNNLNGDISLGAIAITTNYPDGFSVTEALLGGPSGDQNKAVMASILTKVERAKTRSVDKEAKVHLRLYTNTINGLAESTTELIDSAGSVKAWLKNPESRSPSPTQTISLFNSNDESQDIVIDFVDIKTVDMSGEGELSPSSSAWNLVKTIESRRNSDSEDSESFDSISKFRDGILHDKIIDCWLVFEDKDETVESKVDGVTKTESEQRRQEELAAAASARKDQG